MSDSEYEDFGSGDESFDDEFDEVYETKADIFDDEDDCENLKCKILSSSVFLFEYNWIKLVIQSCCYYIFVKYFGTRIQIENA